MVLSNAMEHDQQRATQKKRAKQNGAQEQTHSQGNQKTSKTGAHSSPLKSGAPVPTLGDKGTSHKLSTQAKGTPGKGATGQGTKGNGATRNGTSGKGAAGNGTAGKGTTGKGTRGKGIAGKGTTGNGTSGKGDTGKGSGGKGITGKGSSTGASEAGSTAALSSNWAQLQMALKSQSLQRRERRENEPDSKRKERPRRENEPPNDSKKKHRPRREEQEARVMLSSDAKLDSADLKQNGMTTSIATHERSASNPPSKTSGANNEARLTKVVAMDCEMVGVGREGRRSILARVSLVNSLGEVLYDKHARPLEKVKDFRTHVSGVRKRDLDKDRAEDFWVVQKEVAQLVKGRILVGHALRNDFKVLMLSHPRKSIRDTQRYKPYRGAQGQARSLKSLALDILGSTIQQGEHNSVEDARTALMLYKHAQKDWEALVREKQFGTGNKKTVK